nr:MAG TPA: hypothetical protein [Caudoviricetes sp.]
MPLTFNALLIIITIMVIIAMCFIDPKDFLRF